MLAFKLIANTLPTEQSSVNVPELIVGAVLVSLRPVDIGVVNVGLVANTSEPVPVVEEYSPTTPALS